MNHYSEIIYTIKKNIKKNKIQKKETIEEFLQRGGQIQKIKRGEYNINNEESPWERQKI